MIQEISLQHTLSRRITVLGVPVDNVSMDETIQIIKDTIKNDRHLSHTVINAGKVVLMNADSKLRESVINADLINADGAGVVIASRLLGKPLCERVAGIDLMENIVRLAHEEKFKVFFFGATDDVVSKVVNHYSAIYSPDIIAGFRNGYYKKDEERAIAESIGASGAQILLVAMSSPFKENFLYENADVLSTVNFTMGVGGSFDVVAGKVKRAPLWVQKISMEWAYRVYQEPKRMFKRYLIGNIKFISLFLRYKFKTSENAA
jgi:N-acetylglucosaminyldiphosphoundecaprenol N-acetyl-beta-D-mannosaminyltransferase